MASSLPPIHHLPYDVLLEIFSLSFRDPASTTSLPRICQGWRQIILSTPEFHSTFTFNLNETRPGYCDYIRLLIQRSKEHPLCLTLTGSFKDENRDLLYEVITTYPRWRSVSISMGKWLYPVIRRKLKNEMPFLVSFMVDFPPEASSGVNYFVESLPPLLAPNLEDLQLSYLDRSLYETTTFSWNTLIKFQAPFDAPEDVFRVLTLGPNLTHCSVSRIERHHLHSLAFTSSSILSLSSPWCIAPIITHQLLREFSCSWPNLTSASSSLASIFTRLSLPSLVDLTICSYDPIPLSSLITFLRRSGQGLKKLNLSFKQNTEDRMLSTIFKETPELKELVLDRLQEIEIQQLSDKYLGLLPELEILQVAEPDDSPLLLDMVHTLVERRMMVDVEEEGKVVAKPQGKLNRFIFQKGYSRKLRRKILPESLEWRAGIMLQKQAEKLVNILETTPITDQDQLKALNALQKMQSKDPTGSSLFYSRVPNAILQISCLTTSSESAHLPLPDGDKYHVIQLAKSLLEEYKPKLNEFINQFSRKPIVAMLTPSLEVMYHRIKEEEQDIWHAKLTRDAWSSSPTDRPIPIALNVDRQRLVAS